MHTGPISAAFDSPALRKSARKMRFLPLVAATYFMVSGGPYGIEDILGGAGFLWAIVILLLLPLVWSLPTALMIGELASAIPADGGFYVWVRRGLGPFWGYQEGWLSLSASVFDMAIYPAIFVLYLGKLSPCPHPGWAWLLVVARRGRRGLLRSGICAERPPSAAIPSGSSSCCSRHSQSLSCSASAWPHCTIPPFSGAALDSDAGFSTAVLVAMWNYMGWDNASTVAQDVENPQRTYPRAMIASTALVAVTYILPLAAMALAGLSVQAPFPPATGPPPPRPSAVRLLPSPWWPAERSPASACSMRW
jgi:amino acid transporter